VSWEVSAGFFIIIAAPLFASYNLPRRIALATHFLTSFSWAQREYSLLPPGSHLVGQVRSDRRRPGGVIGCHRYGFGTLPGIAYPEPRTGGRGRS
jgi:hypothetical protein